MIVSRPTKWTDNGKAALTLSNINKHLGQSEVDVIDNAKIKKVHLGKKCLDLNKKDKIRLELNFLQKRRKSGFLPADIILIETILSII